MLLSKGKSNIYLKATIEKNWPYQNFNFLGFRSPRQSKCIFKAGLSGYSDVLAKYKEKVPDVSDSNKNVETKCNS